MTARLLVCKLAREIISAFCYNSWSLVAGAGAYADDTAGAAVATGDGVYAS